MVDEKKDINESPQKAQDSESKPIEKVTAEKAEGKNVDKIRRKRSFDALKRRRSKAKSASKSKKATQKKQEN